VAGISNINATPNSVYYGNCTPNQVTISAQASDSRGIVAVVLFYRLRDGEGNATEWMDIAMNPKGGDLYSRTLDITSIANQARYRSQNGELVYQVVIQNKNQEMTRSQVYSDVEVLACGQMLPGIEINPILPILPIIPSNTPIIIK
jgi:hypothetical protein